MTLDAIVVGAGPAGCVAAIVLARAGARVLVLDRASFPRHKLCGDTLNPGALAVLRRLNLHVADGGVPLDGMIVTGPARARVAVRYPDGIQGRALLRRELDVALVRAAAEAGASVEERVPVRGPVLAPPPKRSSASQVVVGVTVDGRCGPRTLRAHLVIAADGGASRLARSLGLAAHPARPRRWATGAYFTGVTGMTTLGEMHVRGTHYIGIAPLPDGLVNACLVSADRHKLRHPRQFLADVLAAEPELRDRFASAQIAGRPSTLGPLAVDCVASGLPGLLLAGDAAGFIDPLTGDGLRFALRGAELAAAEGLRALETGATDAHRRLAAARRIEFGGKWRFNRAVRTLVGSRPAVVAASYAARCCSWPIARSVTYAGDLGVSARE